MVAIWQISVATVSAVLPSMSNVTVTSKVSVYKEK
jgi:hypothetical protein